MTKLNRDSFAITEKFALFGKDPWIDRGELVVYFGFTQVCYSSKITGRKDKATQSGKKIRYSRYSFVLNSDFNKKLHVKLCEKLLRGY